MPGVQQAFCLCVLVLSLCSHSDLWLTLLRKLASCLSACQIGVQGPLTQRSSEWGRESDEIMAAKEVPGFLFLHALFPPRGFPVSPAAHFCGGAPLSLGDIHGVFQQGFAAGPASAHLFPTVWKRGSWYPFTYPTVHFSSVSATCALIHLPIHHSVRHFLHFSLLSIFPLSFLPLPPFLLFFPLPPSF